MGKSTKDPRIKIVKPQVLNNGPDDQKIQTSQDNNQKRQRTQSKSHDENNNTLNVQENVIFHSQTLPLLIPPPSPDMKSVLMLDDQKICFTKQIKGVMNGLYLLKRSLNSNIKIDSRLQRSTSHNILERVEKMQTQFKSLKEQTVRCQRQRMELKRQLTKVNRSVQMAEKKITELVKAFPSMNKANSTSFFKEKHKQQTLICRTNGLKLQEYRKPTCGKVPFQKTKRFGKRPQFKAKKVENPFLPQLCATRTTEYN